MWQSTNMRQQWWFLQLCLQEWLRSLWQFLLWSVTFHGRLLEVLCLKVFKIFLVYLAICVMIFRLFDVMRRVVCYNYNYKCFQLKEAHEKKLHKLTQSATNHIGTHMKGTQSARKSKKVHPEDPKLSRGFHGTGHQLSTREGQTKRAKRSAYLYTVKFR